VAYAKIVGGLAVAVCVVAPASAATVLRKGAVTNRTITPNAVTSSKVRNGTLRRADLTSALLRPTTVKGPRGPIGDRGPTGAPGPRGREGAAADSSVTEWLLARGIGGSWSMKRFVGLTRESAGVYSVNLYTDIDRCAVLPTISQYPDTQSLVIPPGTIGLRVTGPQTARVDTYDSSGTHADRDFFVLVQC
jgi:hypothetical protein